MDVSIQRVEKRGLVTNLNQGTRQTMECIVIGYTKGKGDRQEVFGALHLAR